ncbi:MAG: hypothetical protein AAFR81_18265, partial [Chloroflexota bacterium]
LQGFYGSEWLIKSTFFYPKLMVILNNGHLIGCPYRKPTADFLCVSGGEKERLLSALMWKKALVIMRSDSKMLNRSVH